MRNFTPSCNMDIYVDLDSLPRYGTNSKQRQEYKRFLYRAIKTQLTKRQTQYILMYYFDHHTMHEIGEILGVNRSTVSRVINTALRRLTELSKLYFDIHK